MCLSKREITPVKHFSPGSKSCSEDISQTDGAEDVIRLDDGRTVLLHQNKLLLSPEDATAHRHTRGPQIGVGNTDTCSGSQNIRKDRNEFEVRVLSKRGSQSHSCCDCSVMAIPRSFVEP